MQHIEKGLTSSTKAIGGEDMCFVPNPSPNSKGLNIRKGIKWDNGTAGRRQCGSREMAQGIEWDGG